MHVHSACTLFLKIKRLGLQNHATVGGNRVKYVQLQSKLFRNGRTLQIQAFLKIQNLKIIKIASVTAYWYIESGPVNI